MRELAPGQTVDQYQLVDVIARSGMATVFRACDLQNGHVVALKVPHLECESDIVFHQRFLREEQIGQRLDHPAVIKVLRPKEKSRVYLAMEYVEGELLSDRLQQESPLPVETAVEIAKQIADALVYLHEHNVVHRDLKPANIMIQPNGKVKLIDFGIAMDTTLRKMTWAKMSHTLGTPDYMAPEQIKGLRGDARTDLYSLAVIVYEMLTGKVPFPAENVFAEMRSKLYDDPIPPRRLRHDISPQLEEIVLHALERDPKERFDSALEFRETLAHPDSVVVTNRASRQRPKQRLPRGLRTSLTVIGGIFTYALLMWAFSSVGAWVQQSRIDSTNPSSSVEHQ